MSRGPAIARAFVYQEFSMAKFAETAGTQIGDVVTLTDEAYTVLPKDGTIILNETDAGAHTLTFATGANGQMVRVLMAAATTGSYTTADVEGNEVVFDAAQECAVLTYDETGDAWYVLAVEGATRP